MLVLILLQGAIDVALIAIAVLWFRTHLRNAEDRSRVTACLNVLESHGARHEKEWTALRSQFQEQVRSLGRLGDEAKTILSQGLSAISIGGGSREEKELADALGPVPQSVDPIPTVGQLEERNSVPRNASVIDLKTLLREQLV